MKSLVVPGAVLVASLHGSEDPVNMIFFRALDEDLEILHDEFFKNDIGKKGEKNDKYKSKK